MGLVKRVCQNENCKKEFYVHSCILKKGHGKYCCKECYEQTRKTNEYILCENYAKIIVKSKKYGEKEVLIDLEDVDKCKKKTWCLCYDNKMKDFYLYAFVKKEKGKRYSVALHRYVMNEPKDLVVDHINTKDRLDNRKSNLRIVTQAINCRNLNEDKFKNNIYGVSFCKRDNVWRCYIGVNRKRINLGTFKSFEEAVKRRKEAELEYWGKDKEKEINKKDMEFNPFLPIKNKNGYIGISKRKFKKQTDKYIAEINVNFKKIYLGQFSTLKEAVEIRNKFIEENGLSNRKNLYREE